VNFSGNACKELNSLFLLNPELRGTEGGKGLNSKRFLKMPYTILGVGTITLLEVKADT